MNSIKIASAISLLALCAACATKPVVQTNAARANSSEAAANTVVSGSRSTADDAATQNNNSRLANEAAMAASRVPPIADAMSGQTLISLGDRVFFLTDSYVLTPEAREILGRQARYLMANPKLKVVIAGNCDERGTREYNLALGARRANSARDYLVSLGVNSSQLQTVSYGKERPIDTRPSNDGWAVNRNAHTSNLN